MTEELVHNLQRVIIGCMLSKQYLPPPFNYRPIMLTDMATSSLTKRFLMNSTSDLDKTIKYFNFIHSFIRPKIHISTLKLAAYKQKQA